MKSENIQNTITLSGFKALKVSFEETAVSNINIEDNTFNLDLEDYMIDAEPNIFFKKFISTLIFFDVDSNVWMKLYVEYATLFNCSEPVNEEFMLSSFATISAPAIGFPFLRAFITNITVQAGYKAVILPSINFIKLAEEKKNAK